MVAQRSDIANTQMTMTLLGCCAYILVKIDRRVPEVLTASIIALMRGVQTGEGKANE
jgi:hypothetical protein